MFPLHPETPDEGRSLEALFSGRIDDIGAMQAQLKQIAAQLELPYGDRKYTYNSRLAQELGKWAETQETGDLFHDAVFKAYFAEGKNIAQTDVLLGIVKKVGLPEKEALKVLETRAQKTAVDEDWARAYRMGITGVPTFVLNGQYLVGAQPYPTMEEFLLENSVNRK